jgi:hypothetical protein
MEKFGSGIINIPDPPTASKERNIQEKLSKVWNIRDFLFGDTSVGDQTSIAPFSYQLSFPELCPAIEAAGRASHDLHQVIIAALAFHLLHQVLNVAKPVGYGKPEDCVPGLAFNRHFSQVRVLLGLKDDPVKPRVKDVLRGISEHIFCIASRAGS